MLSVLAAVFALQPPPIDQPPRLRTILANGSIALVEPHFEAKSICIDLIASSRGAEDTPATHGWRHLLEHLLVKGRDGKMDSRLESEGGFLRAETYRDAMAIQIEVPPDKLELALAAVAELLHEPSITDQAIAKEIPILAAELALSDDANTFANAGWKNCYGAGGLDPQGEMASMATAKAGDLSELYLRHFQSGNLVLVVSGPVDLDGGTKAATDLLSRIPGSPSKSKLLARLSNNSAYANVGARGEAISVPMPAYDSPEAAAALAAALGFCSDREGAFVLYTPSVRPGVVTFGQTSGSGISDALKKGGGADGYYAVGRILARSWLERQLSTPPEAALLRGMLLAQDANATPERMQDTIERLTLAQFRGGFERLQRGVVLQGKL